MSDMKLYNILETFDNLESAADKLTPVEEGAAERISGRVKSRQAQGVGETQTKVQSMGNKVKVTTDGNTTEFDDEETAAAFMGVDDDENSFATESKESDEDEWSSAMGHDGDDPDEMIGSPDDDDDELGESTKLDEFSLGASPGAEIAMSKGDDLEFSTFDSENEAHRKRLQRGTPVVLSPEICSDPDGDRRGIFINRSPSGHYGTVVRDCDGKTVKVHLSDIVSADITNNSVYEEFNINFDALLAEDITMTQTTNLENPANDTTTVTAVGPGAGEELAAMMQNAGLNPGDYSSMDDEASMIDTGEPAQMPAEPMQTTELPVPDAEPQELNANASCGMSEMEDDDEDDFAPRGDVEPSNADLDAIEFGNDDDDYELYDNEIPVHTPMTRAQAMASNEDHGVDKILSQFSTEDLMQWLSNGNDAVDEALMDYSIEDMPYGTQKARTGDPSEWLFDRFGDDVRDYVDNAKSIGEERDIEHANTPNEKEAGVDMVTHGTSGGLNKPKRMHKPAAGGDNPMSELISMLDGMFEDAMKEEEVIDEEVDEAEEKKEWQKPWEKDDKEDDKEEDEDKKEEVEESYFKNEHESVDGFLDLYKEFSIRGEKK